MIEQNLSQAKNIHCHTMGSCGSLVCFLRFGSIENRGSDFLGYCPALRSLHLSNFDQCCPAIFLPRHLTCSTQQVTLTVMEGNIPMFSYSFFPFCSQIIEIWIILTISNKLNNSHFKIFQDISTFYSPSFNHYYQLSARPRFLGARQQIRGRDHRQKPRGHRSASDWWPRWGDHHAGLLSGRHSRNRAKRGCVDMCCLFSFNDCCGCN